VVGGVVARERDPALRHGLQWANGEGDLDVVTTSASWSGHAALGTQDATGSMSVIAAHAASIGAATEKLWSNSWANPSPFFARAQHVMVASRQP